MPGFALNAQFVDVLAKAAVNHQLALKKRVMKQGTECESINRFVPQTNNSIMFERYLAKPYTQVRCFNELDKEVQQLPVF